MHLFADIFGRDNLDFQSREIATISALASLTGAEAQLRSHLSVGRNVGLSEQQLREIASILFAKVGWKQGFAASSVLDEIYHTVTRVPPTGIPHEGDNIFPPGKGSRMEISPVRCT